MTSAWRHWTSRSIRFKAAVMAMAICLGLAPEVGASERLFGARWLNGIIYEIDRTTGVGTIVMTHGRPINGFSSDRNGFVHFVDDDDVWHRYDPITGVVEIVDDLTSALQGRQVRGIGFGPDDRVYFALSVVTFGDIDLARWSLGELETIGRDGRSVQSIAFGPDGTLYGYSLQEGLGTFDLSDATFTSLGGSSQFDIQSLEFDASGRLFAANDALIELDPLTGDMLSELPMACPAVCDLRGVAFVSGPAGCCLPTGACETVASGPTCIAQGGVFTGSDDCSSCSGACCFADGTCVVELAFTCEGLGGTYAGTGSACDVVECFGACCLDDATCIETTEVGCASSGGTYFGRGTTCETAGCTGACCFDDDVCSEQRPAVCAAMGGTYMGDDVPCGSDRCRGSCCVQGSCLVFVTPGLCDGVGGSFNGFASDCMTTRCGACCVNNGSCVSTSAEACDLVYDNGVFFDGARCDDVECASTCVADLLNDDGVVDFDDLSLLLSDWGPCAASCAADLAPNGAVDFDDLSILLASWGPC